MHKELISEIENKIANGEVYEAIKMLKEKIETKEKSNEKVFYLLGNAYCKLNDWQKALNYYQYAIDINPHSPAKHARTMVIDILNFYNKDMFNQ